MGMRSVARCTTAMTFVAALAGGHKTDCIDPVVSVGNISPVGEANGYFSDFRPLFSTCMPGQSADFSGFDGSRDTVAMPL